MLCIAGASHSETCFQAVESSGSPQLVPLELLKIDSLFQVPKCRCGIVPLEVWEGPSPSTMEPASCGSDIS